MTTLIGDLITIPTQVLEGDFVPGKSRPARRPTPRARGEVVADGLLVDVRAMRASVASAWAAAGVYLGPAHTAPEPITREDLPSERCPVPVTTANTNTLKLRARTGSRSVL